MIGVIYNSNNELQSHYITTTLSHHYDLYIFISHTSHLIEPSQKKVLRILFLIIYLFMLNQNLK